MNMQKKSPNYSSYLWLAIGSVLLVFMGGKWNIPVATWLGPIFLMRFFRGQDKWYKTLIALPLVAISMVLFVYKLAPLPPEIPLWFYLFLILGNTLYVVIPYLIDRAVCRTIDHPLTVLVFPAVITTTHFLFAAFGPLGTAGIWGQNLFDFTSLLQFISITGIWGLSFLVGWFTSTVNGLWESGFDISRQKVPVAAFSIVLCLVLIFGGARLYLLRPSSETVKVGSVVVPWPEADIAYGDEGNVFWHYVQMGSPREKVYKYRPLVQALQDELFEQSEGLVAADVKILLWSVGNVTVFQDDEPAFIQRAQAFAKENQIYFFPSILTLKPGELPIRTTRPGPPLGNRCPNPT
jgi:apolipoprotein N-acyltransferase